MDVWLRPDVANAQAELVLKQLTDPLRSAPFFYFNEAMKQIPLASGNILDAGCGVGHYAVFCEKFYPQWNYTGTDFSPTMIKHAKDLAPLGTFKLCDFKENTFRAYDIVLVSQVMEMGSDPWGWLDHVLLQTRGYLILHRLRLIRGYSHRIKEKTYLDIPYHNHEWNKKQLLKRLGPHILIPWADFRQYTIVVYPG